MEIKLKKTKHTAYRKGLFLGSLNFRWKTTLAMVGHLKYNIDLIDCEVLVFIAI